MLTSSPSSDRRFDFRSRHVVRIRPTLHAAAFWGCLVGPGLTLALALTMGVAGCSGGVDSSGLEPGAGSGGAGSAAMGGQTGAGSGGSTSASGGSGQATGGATSSPGGRTGTGGVTGTGSGGTTATGSGGRAGTGGGVGTGGAGTAGATGAGGAVAVSCQWPAPVGADQAVATTIKVSGVHDGGMKRYVGTGALGTATQNEDQGPLFELANGATLQNVILGNPAADGVHCTGTCTLKNVWWEDVGEDAATLKGSAPTQTMTIDGGGATHAADKVFQHNGPGTMIVKNFCAQDFGKLYRSCGNCDPQYARHVQFENVRIVPGASTSAIAGVNSNYNDTATFKAINVQARANSLTVCQRYTGNNTGAEPPKNGAGADGVACIYAASDIIWQ